LHDRAIAQRQAARFVDALSRMRDRLVTDPTECGEPLRTYSKLSLTGYHATFDVIHLHYAIDEAQKIVYINHVRFMSNLGLLE
jgi:hypothetical protein